MATEAKHVNSEDVFELSLLVTGLRQAHPNPKNLAMVFPPEITVREVGSEGPSPYRIRMWGHMDSEVRDNVGPGSIIVGTFKPSKERKFQRRDGTEGTEIELFPASEIRTTFRAISPRRAFGIVEKAE